jgi:RimJ/RimL family protein N-acetyltransferase
LIVIARTSRAIGWVSLRTGDHAPGAAEIGYSVLLAERGKGYAAEAAAALIQMAFEESRLRQVDACCVPANEPSRRLLRGLGFTETRVQRNGAVVRGRPVDIAIYELTRESWLAQRDALVPERTVS